MAPYVIIKNGRLKQGIIDENSIGSFKGRIIERIIRDHGTTAGREFIDDVTRLGDLVVTIMGFTTSIDDEDIPLEAKRQIEEGLDKARRRSTASSWHTRTRNSNPSPADPLKRRWRWRSCVSPGAPVTWPEKSQENTSG